MKPFLLLAFCGCAASGVVTVTANGPPPGALRVKPIVLDGRPAPAQTSDELIDALQQGGLSVVRSWFAFPSDVLAARVSTQPRERFVAPIGNDWDRFQRGSRFAWIHYDVQLALLGDDGRELASAHGEIDEPEGDGLGRPALRRLLRTLGARLAAALSASWTRLTRR